LLPFGYAFGAGIVASVNPCGFLLLPAFIGYHLGDEAQGSSSGEVTVKQLARSLMFGAMVTLGFVALFSAIGSIIAAGGTAIVDAFPWAGLSVGALLGLLGVWLFVTGRSIGITLASRIGRPKGRGPGSAFLYGVAYGAASLSCTLPIFLVVVGTSLASRGVVESVGQFVSYGLGMGAVIVAVSLSAAAFKGSVVQALRGMVPYVHRLSAIVLVGAGVYLVVYWVVLGDILD
jgi:cytochrome c biogenesis protein CcdA